MNLPVGREANIWFPSKSTSRQILLLCLRNAFITTLPGSPAANAFLVLFFGDRSAPYYHCWVSDWCHFCAALIQSSSAVKSIYSCPNNIRVCMTSLLLRCRGSPCLVFKSSASQQLAKLHHYDHTATKAVSSSWFINLRTQPRDLVDHPLAASAVPSLLPSTISNSTMPTWWVNIKALINTAAR